MSIFVSCKTAGNGPRDASKLALRIRH